MRPQRALATTHTHARARACHTHSPPRLPLQKDHQWPRRRRRGPHDSLCPLRRRATRRGRPIPTAGPCALDRAAEWAVVLHPPLSRARAPIACHRFVVGVPGAPRAPRRPPPPPSAAAAGRPPPPSDAVADDSQSRARASARVRDGTRAHGRSCGVWAGTACGAASLRWPIEQLPEGMHRASGLCSPRLSGVPWVGGEGGRGGGRGGRRRVEE